MLALELNYRCFGRGTARLDRLLPSVCIRSRSRRVAGAFPGSDGGNVSPDDERDAGGTPDAGDPLDEPTLPMKTRADGRPESDPAEADTTTLGTAIPPPIVVDERDAAGPAPAAGAERPSPTSASLAPSASLRPVLLERVEPSLGRGERLRLDASQWNVVLGRAEESDIRLYTASASRQHATIAGNARGEWLLTPAPGKTVWIDGEQTTRPIVLEVGMNIVLGQDHLRCVTEGLESRDAAAVTSAGGPEDDAAVRLWHKLATRWGVGAIGVGLIVLAGLLWMLVGPTGGER